LPRFWPHCCLICSSTLSVSSRWLSAVGGVFGGLMGGYAPGTNLLFRSHIINAFPSSSFSTLSGFFFGSKWAPDPTIKSRKFHRWVNKNYNFYYSSPLSKIYKTLFRTGVFSISGNIFLLLLCDWIANIQLFPANV